MFIHRGKLSQYIVGSSQMNVLNESRERTRMFSPDSMRSGAGTMVFVSHKHSDLNNIELFGLLELMKAFNVIPYIDCMDPKMPKNTCAETANRIKLVINHSYRFVLIATEDALRSMWCNWEVGIADKTKYANDNMAILPILERTQSDEDFAGNEYLQLYPYIYEERSLSGSSLYKVYVPRTGQRLTLDKWLNK